MAISSAAKACLNLEGGIGKLCGKPLAGLFIADAFRLIDAIEDARTGKLDLEDGLRQGE